MAVQSHVKVQARTVMAKKASKPSATSPRWAAATRCGAKGPSNVGEGVKTRPPARGRARGGRQPPSAVHASFGRGARQGGAEPRGASRLRPTPARERPPSTVGTSELYSDPLRLELNGHFRQDGICSSKSIKEVHDSINSLRGICSQKRGAWHAGMADFVGWSRPLHESLPLAGAALEAGSVSEPLGTPVVDVPTQPPFLLGTAMVAWRC